MAFLEPGKFEEDWKLYLDRQGILSLISQIQSDGRPRELKRMMRDLEPIEEQMGWLQDSLTGCATWNLVCGGTLDSILGSIPEPLPFQSGRRLKLLSAWSMRMSRRVIIVCEKPSE